MPDENRNKSCVFSRLWKVYENRLNILLYIILLFVNYLFNQNVILIIDKFSPIHYAVASVFENFALALISICYKEISVEDFFISLALYILLILAALIYNEFIILNFCGFQKYTYLFLQKEANKDLELTILNDNEKEDENDRNILFPEDEDNGNEEKDLYSQDEYNKNEIINIKENFNNDFGNSNLTKNKE